MPKHFPFFAIGIVCIVLELQLGLIPEARAQAQGSNFSAPALDSTTTEAIRKLIRDAHYAEAETRAREILKQSEAKFGSESIQVAQCLDLLVESLWRNDRGTSPQCRDLAERAVKIKEATLGPAHVEVAKSLRNLAIVSDINGDRARALALFERILAIKDKALKPDDPDLARSLLDLGVFLSQEDPAKARPFIERGLAIQEKTLGHEHPDVAKSFYSLSQICYQVGDYKKAEEYSRQALSIDEKVLGPDHPFLGTILSDLAKTLDVTGDYDGARATYERAIAIFERSVGPETLDVAAAVQNLGIVLQESGDSQGARALFLRALAIKEKILGPNDPRVAYTLNNLGIVERDFRNFDEAQKLYERSLVIYEKALGPDHPQVAETLGNLGNLFVDLDSLDAAQGALERALAILEKNLGPDHPDVGTALQGLAAVLRVKGKYKESITALNRALAIQETGLGPEHPLVAITLRERGNAFQLSGNPTAARSDYERALAIQERSLGPKHPTLIDTCSLMAGLFAQTGDVEKAFEYAMRVEAIHRDYTRLTVRTLAEGEALRVASSQARGLDLALTLLSDHPKDTWTAEVWNAVIQSRGLVLDMMSERYHKVAEADQVVRLANALKSAELRLANLTVRGPGPEGPEKYRQLLVEAGAEKEQAETALADRSHSYEEKQKEERIDLKEVGENLPRRRALVAFVQYNHRNVKATDRPSEPRYFAFVLSSGGKPRAFDLGAASQVDSLVSLWRSETSRPPVTTSPDLSSGMRLRKRIWDPITPALGDAELVFVVPDGVLQLVNLSSLPLDKSKYLVEAGPVIHLLNTERDLAAASKPPSSNHDLLALGDPDYDAAPTATDTSSSSADHSFRGVAPGCQEFSSLRWGALPGTGREVDDLVGLWRKQFPAETNISLKRADASEAKFKELAAGKRILHLATHGFFLGETCGQEDDGGRGRPVVLANGHETVSTEAAPGEPGPNPLLLSGLVLAGANHHQNGESSLGEDGILTAEEVTSLQLSGVEWAVLSACETGVGSLKSGEGVFGLRRAFQIAGVDAVIVSLWPVDDEAAHQWMTRLYESRIVNKRSTADAVHLASLGMLRERREKGESTHPFYWAAFVAAGDWR